MYILYNKIEFYKLFTKSHNIENNKNELIKIFNEKELFNSKYKIDNINLVDQLYQWINNKLKITTMYNGEKIFKYSTIISLLTKELSKFDNNDTKMFSYFIIESALNSSFYKNKYGIKNLNNIIDLFKKILSEQNSKDINIPDNNIYDQLKETNDILWICLSRYPKDVMSMSTGQGWTSCQDLNSNGYSSDYTTHSYSATNWHIKYDVALGTCIVYLISDKNKELSKNKEPNNPLYPLLNPRCRFLIKPFYDKNNNIYLTPGNTPVFYPSNEIYKDKITDIINNFLESKQSNISGEFYLPKDVYWDPMFDNDRASVITVENGKIRDYLNDDYMNNNENQTEWDIIVNDNIDKIKKEIVMFKPKLSGMYAYIINKNGDLRVIEDSKLGYMDDVFGEINVDFAVLSTRNHLFTEEDFNDTIFDSDDIDDKLKSYAVNNTIATLGSDYKIGVDIAKEILKIEFNENLDDINIKDAIKVINGEYIKNKELLLKLFKKYNILGICAYNLYVQYTEHIMDKVFDDIKNKIYNIYN